ncbi:hypothetical protein Nepgr_013138 [Nepenthes gracilis]|uniref:Uncharacterized protein n=1 Tax=Nepenthes gracilis TaxID=150966 RepID=A0AAD3SIJ7_NEPGR|nr:hypothetical protein Nepgr_013138 [Nepenthes gracilis]
MLGNQHLPHKKVVGSWFMVRYRVLVEQFPILVLSAIEDNTNGCLTNCLEQLSYGILGMLKYHLRACGSVEYHGEQELQVLS